MGNVRGMRTFAWAGAAFWALAAITTPALAADADRDSLVAGIVAFQKAKPGSAEDKALRAKLPAQFGKFRGQPAPREAARFEGRAEAAVQAAKTPADYLDAAKAFEQAIGIAPWIAAYHYNRGLVLEKAGRFGEAARSLELYLLADSKAKDARDVEKKIAGLEYRQEKAGRPQTSTPPASAPSQPKGPNLAALAGRWRVQQYLGNYKQRPVKSGPWSDGRGVDGPMEAQVRIVGNGFQMTLFDRGTINLPYEYSGQFDGRTVSGTVTIRKDPHPPIKGLAPNYVMTQNLSRQLFPCGPGSMTQREPFTAEIDFSTPSILVYSRGFLDETTCRRNAEFHSLVYLLRR